MDDKMIDNFMTYCKDIVAKHPDLTDEVHDFFDLCMMEIEGGGSQPHEIELAMSDIDDLVTTKLKSARG